MVLDLVAANSRAIMGRENGRAGMRGKSVLVDELGGCRLSEARDGRLKGSVGHLRGKRGLEGGEALDESAI
jgi:hypothetical protein